MVTAEIESSLSDLNALYHDDYFNGDEYADYVGDKRVIQRNMQKWLRIVREYVPSGSLVEVGCAYGFFLELAREYFDVMGIDVSKEATDYARSRFDVSALSGDFLSDNRLTPASVDVVTMWDFIEHASAPDKFVARAQEILRPGGYLFLTTGDMDSWMAHRQGANWRLIHPPTHLQYFSRATMSKLLGRYGFSVVKVTYPGYWRSIKQILHGLFVFGKLQKPSFIHRVLSRVLPQRMGVYLNTHDIMLVAARKTG